jgi:UDP-2-acetamido-3-amino-2,3-dideoxy-glucuronate N-acetyltransferase
VQSKIQGVKLVSLPTVQAARGDLTAIELPQIVPFEVRRIFLVHHVSDLEIRGEHAHKICWQFLIAAAGSITVDVTDGKIRDTFLLDNPAQGLLIPPLIWGTQYNYSSDGLLLVLASEKFDPDDYLHNFEEFLIYRNTNS